MVTIFNRVILGTNSDFDEQEISHHLGVNFHIANGRDK